MIDQQAWFPCSDFSGQPVEKRVEYGVARAKTLGFMSGRISTQTRLGVDDHFSDTQWTDVRRAGHPGEPGSDQALETLCQKYWPPIYAYVRRHGYSPADAQDLTQGFFARLLEKNSFASADRKKGKFRTYLLGALKHFLADEWDKVQAEKRGGKVQFVSLDDVRHAERTYLEDHSSDATPERAYDRRWAKILLEQALTRLQEEMYSSGKANQFDALKQFVTGDPQAGDYEAAAAQLDTTSNAVSVTVYRMRRRWHELIRREIKHTVTTSAEVEEELRNLLR